MRDEWVGFWCTVCEEVGRGELELREVVPGGDGRGVLSMDKKCERQWSLMACWTDGTDEMFSVAAVSPPLPVLLEFQLKSVLLLREGKWFCGGCLCFLI